ncbi:MULTISPECIES: peptidoglycan DD-metalloendopeptidase family protein [unclassified Polynucleobacter]|uniref:peptidoglycan DD-metalloendopeptidase family protein n=1 Tax=unclassified Polynucleobacter TaxID=2640945 RepID=UPI0008AB41C2|nr:MULTISPECIES: peptidoglycan DD-metalloendopeptidase family protein [unclassified Polynucleobacter]OHC09414.1 MAG: peptidase M23 [Polynucleobacter sp. GWA2_45_21]HBK43937.1 peptidase M23 [Polynucleobacter sp.]
MKMLSKYLLLLLAMTSLLLNVGCSTTPRAKPANVVDRSGGGNEPAPPGYYRVKRGDTLARIALDNGQSPRDLAQWNNLSNPNLIEVGDLILVKPPANSRMTVKPIPKTASDAPKADAPKVDAAKEAPKEVVAEPGIRLSWPAKGKVTEEFSEKTKGIDIAGKLGEPITAASDGKVVYAGNSLRGYGNLVIIKHDNTYLTAYAHNRTLSVKEGDPVKKGQKIAEMGDTDTNSVKLHFELRVNGKPVNPTPYLQ